MSLEEVFINAPIYLHVAPPKGPGLPSTGDVVEAVIVNVFAVAEWYKDNTRYRCYFQNQYQTNPHLDFQ